MSGNTISLNPIFIPTQVPGCALWLDAADSSTLSLTGSSVTQWRDKSGNARDAVGNLGTGTYSSNGFNSLPTIQITATGNMRVPVAAGTFSSGIVVFVVFQKTGANTVSDTIVTRTLANSLPSPYDIYTNSGSTTRLVGNGTTYGIQNNSTTIAQTTTPTLWNIALFSGSPTVWSEYVNGTLATYTIVAAGGATSVVYGDTATEICIGTRSDAYTKMNGNISEIITYNAATFSTSQRQQTEGYLAWKWGLVGSLPSNHPYKTTPVYAITTIPPSLRANLPTSMAASSSPFAFFNPTSIGGCALWLDATDPATVTASAGIVSAWRDKSGTNKTVTFANTNTYTANTSVNTNSSGSAYFYANVDLRKSIVPYATIFTVHTWAGSAVNSNQALWGQDDGGWNRLQLLSMPATTIGYGLTYTNASPNVINITSLSTASRTLYSATYAYLITNGTYATVNGTNSSLVTEAAASPQTGSQNTSFGAQNASGGILGSVNFHEIIMYTSGSSNITIAQRQQIEGYLAWKWGLPSDLPANHPFKNSPPGLSIPVVPLTRQLGNRFFGPSSIPGCLLWFNAADTSSVLGANPVTGWVNRGSIATTATVSAGTPRYLMDSAGRPYISMPTGSQLQFTTTLNTQARTWFAVVRNTQQLANDSTFRIVNATTNGQGSLFIYLFSGDYVLSEGPTGVRVSVAASVPNPLNTIEIYSLINSTSVASNVITRYGTVLTSGTGSAAADYTTANVNYLMPSTAAGGDYFEILFFAAALTPPQRQQVEGYLAWKWGLQANLPSNHPFSKWPPPPS